jgi:hypothetical protein
MEINELGKKENQDDGSVTWPTQKYF